MAENSDIKALIESNTLLASEVRRQNDSYQEIRKTLFGESGTIGEGLVGKHLELANKVDGHEVVINGRKKEPGLVHKVACIKKQINHARIAIWSVFATVTGMGALVAWLAKAKGLFLDVFKGS